MTSSIDRRRFAFTMLALRVSMLVAICGSAGPGQAAVFGCAAGDTNVSYGDNVTCQIETLGDSDRFRFTAAAGDKVIIQAVNQASSGGPCVQVFAPGGVSLWSSCTLFDTLRKDLILADSGDHLIRISSWENGSTMDYAVSLERVFPITPNATPLNFGANVTSKLDLPLGSADYYRFTAAAGDKVIIQAVRQGSSGGPCVQVFAPGGVSLWSSCTLFRTLRKDLILADSGDHLIRISSWENGSTMDYVVSVECFGVCPAVGPGPGQQQRLTVSPSALIFALQRDGDPGLRLVIARNTSSQDISFTASANTFRGGPWLAATPTGGNIGGSSSASLTVIASPNGLAPGAYSGSVPVQGGGETVTIPVTMTVSPAADSLRRRLSAHLQISGSVVVPPTVPNFVLALYKNG